MTALGESAVATGTHTAVGLRQHGRLAGGVAGAVVGLGLWLAVAELTAAKGFPDPVGVARAVRDAATGLEFYEALGPTLRRVVIAWSIAYSVGVVWGILAARSRGVDGLLRPWMLVGLALPSPVAVLFSVLLFGLSETSAILGLVLVTMPFVANIVYENTAAVPTRLLQMGTVYQLGLTAEMRHIILPYLVPALLASARLGLQLSWKLVVVMEAIVRPDGIGERLSFYFKLLQPNLLVAYTLLFGILLVAVEVGLFRPLSRHLSRWRGEGRTV